ncbi:hypothetical protein DPEC_G00045340 [Dallia pectoralis]|uniref:Uncharacterized protein n=1 Tax=Dallia pectoralis TaxID=75939 RepID=A0ACC2H9K1_DALPE|nr:hypothetical protein DPEC_G00045340 [Dallia pectoralis]
MFGGGVKGVVRGAGGPLPAPEKGSLVAPGRTISPAPGNRGDMSEGVGYEALTPHRQFPALTQSSVRHLLCASPQHQGSSAGLLPRSHPLFGDLVLLRGRATLCHHSSSYSGAGTPTSVGPQLW